MIDALASLPHYRDHLRPVWDALPEGIRGRFYEVRPEIAGTMCLVSSYSDQRLARKAGYTRFVVMEHGAGQSYSNDHPAYAGGRDRGDAGLFLTPNEHAAGRWRAAYPNAAVEVVGSPRLDSLPARKPGAPTIAISFHWDCQVAPESRSALPHYRRVLPEMAQAYNVIGHGHPRANLGRMYERLGIEYVPSFDEICRRADLYIHDQMSTLYEFASTGRPVVVLNQPSYRRNVRHGLRFWDAADVGIQVDEPDQLIATIERALVDPPEIRSARNAALELVYAYRSGGAERAADAIVAWLRSRQAVAA